MEKLGKLAGAVDYPHPPAAPAGSRLDHHGKADVIGPAAGFFDRLQRFVSSRQDRQPRFLYRSTRSGLIAHQPNLVGFRPDESNARHFADFSETSVFGEEAVAGVNGVDVGDFGGTDHA